MAERPRMTLAEWADEWSRIRTVRPKTAALEAWILKQHVLPALGHLELEAIGRGDVARWRDRVAASGTATAQRAMAVLRAVLRSAVEYGLLDDSPAERVRSVRYPQRVLIPSAEEVCLAIAQLARYEHRLAAAVAAASGLRWGEQFALRPSDVIRAGDRVGFSVLRQRPAGLDLETPPKTQAGERIVPVWQGLEEGVLHLASLHRPWLWTGDRGGPVAYGWWRRLWAEACRRAGVRIRWHDLRHHAASLWIASGWDVASVAAALGHSSPAVTLRIYVRQFRERQFGHALDLRTFTLKLLDSVHGCSSMLQANAGVPAGCDDDGDRVVGRGG